MNRPLAAVLGLLSLVPGAFMLLGLLCFLPHSQHLLEDPHAGPSAAFTFMNRLGLLVLSVGVIAIAQAVGCLRHVWRSPRCSDGQKVAWTIAIAMTGGLVLPLAWHRFVWHAAGGTAA